MLNWDDFFCDVFFIGGNILFNYFDDCVCEGFRVFFLVDVEFIVRCVMDFVLDVWKGVVGWVGMLVWKEVRIMKEDY